MLITIYKTVLVFHLIGVFFWVAALFTLPRQLVYHCDSIAQGDGAASLRAWHERERRTFFYILTPMVLLSLLTAATMVALQPALLAHAWIHLILLPTALLLLYQGACWHLMGELHRQTRVRSRRFYLVFNEIVAIPLVAILYLVVFKPV